MGAAKVYTGIHTHRRLIEASNEKYRTCLRVFQYPLAGRYGSQITCTLRVFKTFDLIGVQSAVVNHSKLTTKQRDSHHNHTATTHYHRHSFTHFTRLFSPSVSVASVLIRISTIGW